MKGTILNSLRSVIYLFEIYLFNLEFAVLLPIFAIHVHANGTCVCNIVISLLVSHYAHELWEQNSELYGVHTLFPLHFKYT
jgi:hypothetical protein